METFFLQLPVEKTDGMVAVEVSPLISLFLRIAVQILLLFEH